MISASEKCARSSDQSASSTLWWSTASFSANRMAARSRGLRRSDVSSSTASMLSGSSLAIVRSPSRKVDDLDPVRILAHRVLLQLRQLAARLVDRVARQAVRELADREQVAARGIDAEAARLLLGRHAADRGQGAVGGVDLEPREGARRALRAVEELAVRGDVEVGGRGLALE